MNTAACDPKVPAHWAAILDDCLQRMKQVHTVTGLGHRALGVAGWDAKLWQMGRAWVENHGASDRAMPKDGGDVYLATQLYAQGGHTALMGDFIQALRKDSEDSPRVVITNIRNENKTPIPDKILARLGLLADCIDMLHGESLRERMDQMLQRLNRLRPKRLFLFHHPEDPLASVAAQPDLAGQCIFVHHADAAPSFGLQVPGIRIIELNPVAAAMSRMLGLAPACLHLTSPDPGPRPGGFLQRDRLMTASSGAEHKFTKPYFYDYPGTVGVILSTTGGWHLHIGPLSDANLENIRNELGLRDVSSDRFIHVPWTASIAASLWEHQVDVYVSSFPTDGARTNVEVLASGTPHLRHALNPNEHWMEGSLTWDTWENLTSTLRRLADPAFLLERSQMLRRTYERQHHPQVFAQILREILSGGKGWQDARESVWDIHVMRSLSKSLTAALIKQGERLAHLEDQLRHPAADHVTRGWRGRLQRWLGKH